MGLLNEIKSSGETVIGRENFNWTLILNNFTISLCCISLLRQKRRNYSEFSFFLFLSFSWHWKFLAEIIFSGKNVPRALCVHVVEKGLVCCNSSSCFSNTPLIFTANKKKTTHGEGRVGESTRNSDNAVSYYILKATHCE